MNQTDILRILAEYSGGRLGTRDAIAALDLQDYADLIIALARHDLPFPPPSQHPRVVEDRDRASLILSERLRLGA